MLSKICIYCKGKKFLCGRINCVYRFIFSAKKPVEEKLKERMFSPSSGIFVGRMNYPNVFAGPVNVISSEHPFPEEPSLLYGRDFEEIIGMRINLLRSKKLANVAQVSGRFVENVQEVALSKKSVDVEVHFKRKPVFSPVFSHYFSPLGASGELKSVALGENPKIPQSVEKIISEPLKAREQVAALYERGCSETYIARVLSAGALGRERKLVPTRWSITAVDSVLADSLLKRIRNYGEIDKYLLWKNEYLDNRFVILFLPGKWYFEQFEAWFLEFSERKYHLVLEREGFGGRSDYAEKQGGGYYASRLAVCEKLEEMKRQASVVVFREIYRGYILPLGVWVVRETVRHAFEKKPEAYSSLREALSRAGQILKVPMSEYVKKSTLLAQKKLADF